MLSRVAANDDDRVILTVTGLLWLLALPDEALWKPTYIDEHALQPAQVG